MRLLEITDPHPAAVPLARCHEALYRRLFGNLLARLRERGDPDLTVGRDRVVLRIPPALRRQDVGGRSDVRARIERLLGEHGWRLVDWRVGHVEREVERTRPDTGERIRRTERRRLVPVLREIADADVRPRSEIEALIRAFENDPSRRTAAAERRGDEPVLVLTFDPLEVAHMSTRRGWVSCRTIDDDGDASVPPALVCDLKAATVTAWLTDAADAKTLDHPTGRVNIRVFRGPRDSLLFRPERTTYGDVPPWFHEAVRRLVERLNALGVREPGIYCPVAPFEGDTVAPVPVLAGMDAETAIRRLAVGDRRLIATIRRLLRDHAVLSIFELIPPEDLLPLVRRDRRTVAQALARLLAANAAGVEDERETVRLLLAWLEGRPPPAAPGAVSVAEFLARAHAAGLEPDPVRWTLEHGLGELAARILAYRLDSGTLRQWLDDPRGAALVAHLGPLGATGDRPGMLDRLLRDVSPEDMLAYGLRQADDPDAARPPFAIGGPRHLAWLLGVAIAREDSPGRRLLAHLDRVLGSWSSAGHGLPTAVDRLLRHAREVARSRGRADVVAVLDRHLDEEAPPDAREVLTRLEHGDAEGALRAALRGGEEIMREAGRALADATRVRRILERAPDRLVAWRVMAQLARHAGTMQAVLRAVRQLSDQP